MTASLKLTPKIHEKSKEDMLEMLDRYKQLVDSGEVVRLGIVTERSGGNWGTEFSYSEDNRLDAAMLLELALRRLGFATK